MKTLRITLSLLIVLLFSHQISEAQKIRFSHLGIGYTFARSSLKNFNNFIEDYNEDRNNDGNRKYFIFPDGTKEYSVMTEEMAKLHGLKGIYLSSGVSYDQLLFELNYQRRFGDTRAVFSAETSENEHIRSLGFGLRTISLVTYYQYNEGPLSMYSGFGLDFNKVFVKTMHNMKDEDWRIVNEENNFGFSPRYMVMLQPVDEFPLRLGFEVFYQLNFKGASLQAFDDEMAGNYQGEKDKLKSSGSNIGITFFAKMGIPHIKFPEKKPKEPKPTPIPTDIMVAGKVVDRQTGKLVGSVVKYNEATKPQITLDAPTGTFSVELLNNHVYTFTAEAFGYADGKTNISLSGLTNPNYSFTIYLDKVKTGEAIKLNNIYFEKGSAVLMPESYPELAKLYKFLSENETVQIEIAGHTSSEGSDAFNMSLSQDRAQSIVNYLIGKGISKDQLIAKGYGETSPVASNETEEGRILNRRVEFKILKQ